jgi:hypothetical protein
MNGDTAPGQAEAGNGRVRIRDLHDLGFGRAGTGETASLQKAGTHKGRDVPAAAANDVRLDMLLIALDRAGTVRLAKLATRLARASI